jgi:hypothetical protein
MTESFLSDDKSDRPECDGCGTWAPDYGVFTWKQDPETGNWYCPSCREEGDDA